MSDRPEGVNREVEAAFHSFKPLDEVLARTYADYESARDGYGIADIGGRKFLMSVDDYATLRSTIESLTEEVRTWGRSHDLLVEVLVEEQGRNATLRAENSRLRNTLAVNLDRAAALRAATERDTAIDTKEAGERR